MRLSAGGRARAVAGEDARALEAHLVARLGVGDVDLPVHRVDGHVEQDGADAARRSRAPDLRRRVGDRVDGEHVLVGQRELHRVVPVRGRARRPSAAPLHLTMRPTPARDCPGRWSTRRRHLPCRRRVRATQERSMTPWSGCRCGSRRRRRVMPSGVTASARGVSVKRVTIVSGVPPSAGAERRPRRTPRRRRARRRAW